MKKVIIFYLIVGMSIFAPTLVSWAEPLTQAQRQATLNYIANLQNPDSGFRPSSKAGPSDLGATSSSIRALKYLGGKVKNKAQVERFMLKFVHESGGFSAKLGEAPDVRSTWFGVNALVNLRGSPPENAKRIVDFVTNNAKSLYPEIYFAAAALEDIKMKSPKASEWIAAFEATLRPDGSYGEFAPDTAHAVVVTLRLGGTLRDRASAAKVLKAAQRQNGGFAGKGDVVNMPNTYTVMRALMMLKEKPDLGALHRFVASCRNTDGGYGIAPGKPSNMTFTYFASAVLHWAEEMER